MAVITHDARLAFDAATGLVAENVLGAVYLDTDTGLVTPLTVTIFGAGSTTTQVTSDINGVIPELDVDQATNGLTGEEGTRIVWASGAHRTTLISTKRVYTALNTLNDTRAPVFVSTGGDDTAALNTYLSTGTGTRRLVGSFTVTGPVTVPAGVTLDARGATITQTGAGQTTIILGGDNAALVGGEIVGRGPLDYVAGGSSNAHGVSTTSTTGCRISGSLIRNHGGAQVRAITATAFQVDGCRLVGVGSPTIAATVGSSCYGVYLDTSCTNVAITNCDISDANQGIIGGLSVTHLTLSNLRVHDIPGQHGIYVQNGTGLNVTGADVWSVVYNAMKLQLSGSSTADSEATLIRGFSAAACGDTALSVNNVATDLTSAKRVRGLSISDLAATGCGRVLYLGSVRGGTVTNITGYNNSLDGITFLDCKDVNLSNVALDVVGRIGIRFTLATGSAQDRITCSNVRINNPANTNTASNLYGIYLLQGSNITLDGLNITASNGFLEYGIFVASATAADQETLSVRNADLSGDTGTTGRFRSTTTTVRDWTNVRFSGAFMFKPTGVVAPTVVP